MTNRPLQIIATDFDGTLHTDMETPSVPGELQALLGQLQAGGVKWVINTGRTQADLLSTLERARLSVQPDFLVVVEREIHCRHNGGFVELADWNQQCRQDQDRLFARLRPQLPTVRHWIQSRFSATIYEDTYSPFCLIAETDPDTDAIMDYLVSVFRDEPELIVVRNSVYARFSHAAYNKGSALCRIARQVSATADTTLAAGDHYNDLAMLSSDVARYLVAPANAVDQVKNAVRRQQGFVSQWPCGRGVVEGLQFFLDRPA